MAYAGWMAGVRRGLTAGLVGAGLVGAGLVGIGLAAEDEEGFVSLFDGSTMAGWQPSENTGSWSVVDGQLVCHGPRSHLFYVGADPATPSVFKNFHFRAEVMTKPGSNSGIFIHSRYQAEGWPVHGYEVQVNNSQRDPVRTGSLYNTVKIFTPPAQDDKWFTMDVIVRGRAVNVAVDGNVLYEFMEPEGTSGTRRLSEGLFALQAHDPDSEVHYRNIRVKRLD